MIIVDILRNKDITGLSPIQPYIFEMRPVVSSLAPFWTDIFGAPDDSTSQTIFVRSFIRDFTIGYNEVFNFNDLEAQEKSFWWDDENQIQKIHLEHDQSEWSDFYQYGVAFGFSDKDVVYIDDQEYSPLILSIPTFAQQQDLINYDQLSFINGLIRLNNQGRPDGELDSFITEDIYGNDVFISYLDDDLITEPNEASRSDLQAMAGLYIEDYDITLQSIELRVQDKRKSQDADIPVLEFDISDYPDIDKAENDIVPLMYGTVRESKAIPTNDVTTSGDVYYRVALLLTTLGTVQVDIDGIWTTKTPTSTLLSSGEFILSSADGRNTNGSVRDCRVLRPEGIPITYTSDIIVDLNERFRNIEFIASNYDLVEWAAEEVGLSSGGWVFDSQVKLFDAIKVIQNGSSVGFRYEINAEGKRTIRIDSNDRDRVGRVEPVDIQNRNVMPVSTDSDLVFATIQVDYNKSFNSDKNQNVKNNDFADQVKASYKSQNKRIIKSVLNSAVDASARAALDAERFSVIPSIMSLILMGKDFLSLRIFDIYDVEATPDFADVDNDIIIGRQYYRFKRVKVIGIDPNLGSSANSVRLQLLDDAVIEAETGAPVYGASVYGGMVYG